MSDVQDEHVASNWNSPDRAAAEPVLKRLFSELRCVVRSEFAEGELAPKSAQLLNLMQGAAGRLRMAAVMESDQEQRAQAVRARGTARSGPGLALRDGDMGTSCRHGLFED